MTEILYTDISPEEKIIRAMEIKREAEHIKQLFKVILKYNHKR